ncbi:MAG: hypothetical protein NTU81_02940 [Candidatus Nomurabacteria bacterium]|nr:hypothetical protein [Candidatus Nomurabacteria bacterium]
MNTKNIEILKSFDLENIPDLDIVVLGALELFQKEELPKINLDEYHHPLIIGSGNAEATGRIIFEEKDAIFASESNYEQKLENIKTIDSVIVISASGGKHAPIIAKRAKELGKRVVLITNNKDAEAIKFVDSKDVFIFPKNREPYTYNTSTYMGMILGKTHENTSDIQNFIEKNIDTIDMTFFSKYEKYFLIVPTKFSGIIRMLQVKFIELFGRIIAHDVETTEYMKHAVTVVPANELFISFGDKNDTYGDPQNRLYIPLPENADYVTMMAIGYYVISKIQKQHEPYFKKNIAQYIVQASKAFNHEMSAIVE